MTGVNAPILSIGEPVGTPDRPFDRALRQRWQFLVHHAGNALDKSYHLVSNLSMILCSTSKPPHQHRRRIGITGA
jgi:hypothetical protein